MGQLQGTAYDLRADLRKVGSPILLAFDTYERANGEARELVEGLLLADLDRLDGVRLVIAGQDVPDHAHALWAGSVRHFSLKPITEPKFWRLYAERHHLNVKAEHVEALTLEARALLASYAQCYKPLHPLWRSNNADIIRRTARAAASSAK